MNIEGLVALEDRAKIMSGPGLPVTASDAGKDQRDAEVLARLRQGDGGPGSGCPARGQG